jgi:phosphopentomutase
MALMSDIDRAVVIVLDSCGAGEAPDADDYGDAGADTLGHTAEAVGGLALPNFQAAGLGNLHPDLLGVPPAPHPTMAFGKLTEASVGKDSTTGHWELAGIISKTPTATFTATGFPDALVRAVEEESGHHFIGNYAASGTVIIEALGPEHLETGALILYTSADSVFQIAAHKDIVPLDELYGVCEIARRHCNDYNIGRVIARPFEGELGALHRTYERHDYAMPPHSATVLDHASGAGLPVVGIGKIEDLFAGRGLTAAMHTEGDADGLEKTLEALDQYSRGLIFTNLVDLDMVYGHRENPAGYATGLALIDSYLPRLIDRLTHRDLLFFSADHGNDPTDGSTDHTREYVPLLVHGQSAAGVDLGIREQYCDVAATISEALNLAPPTRGVSFLAEVT